MFQNWQQDVTTLFVVVWLVFQEQWMVEVQRGTSLRGRQIWDNVTSCLWGNGRIVVCGCAGKLCQIRWTSRLLQVFKEELLRCIGWNRLPARRLTVYERILLDTFATRNFLRFYFHVLLFIKRLRSFDMAWSPGVMFSVRCIYKLSLVGRPPQEKSCFKPESYKFKEQKLQKKSMLERVWYKFCKPYMYSW